MKQTPHAFGIQFARIVSARVASNVFRPFVSAGTLEGRSIGSWVRIRWSSLARVGFGVAILALGCQVYAQTNLTGAYERAFTIDHTKVSNSDQINFPILISDIFPFLATTANGGQVLNANGYDIIFTSDVAGHNMLSFEIDNYNPTTGAASFWVGIPTLSHTSDTTIYMFYGIPSITTSQQNPAGVWSNGYLSVYHLGNGTTVGVTDSGSAGYTLTTPTGSPSAVAGRIGGGVAFNGDPATALSYDSPVAYPSGASPVTLEAWAQLASTNGGEIVGYGDNSATGSRDGLWWDGNHGFVNWGNGNSGFIQEFDGIGVGVPFPYDNNWHHIVSVYGGGALSTSNDYMYFDGVPLSAFAGGGLPAITTTELEIGGIPTVTYCCAFNGSVDEVRVSSVARSADWVATEYANESSPSTFYSVGSQRGGPTGSYGTLACFPSTLDAGSNTTCSVVLASGATGEVAFSLDGQSNATATPSNSGEVDAVINLASAAVGSHTVAFSYPGDANNPAASGSTTITIQSSGSPLPNANTVYQFSITQPDGVTSGYAPNGSVVAYTDSVNGQWSMSNGYDGLNRLVSATQTPVTGPQLSFCWNYDNFGNRMTQATSPSPFGGTPGVDCTTRVTGTLTSNAWVHYNTNNQATADSQSVAPNSLMPDASGNMGADGTYQYLYDAEGRVCAVETLQSPYYPMGCLYDAEGRRVAKGKLSQFSCNLATNGFTVTNEYLHDASGGQLTELDGQGLWVHTNVFAEGQIVATYEKDAQGVHFHFTDWQGTRRMQTDYQGDPELQCQGGSFGDALTCLPINNASDATEIHFTGKERDGETGNDYFGARYYASSMGRFTTPDWSTKLEPVPYSKLDNPQTLNLYSYVENNPLSNVDSDGHGDEVSCEGSSNCHTFNDESRVPKKAQHASTFPLPTPVPFVLPSLGEAATELVAGIISVTTVTVGATIDYLISPGTTATEDKDTIKFGPPPSTSQQGAVDNAPITSSNAPRSTLPRGPGGQYLPLPEAQGPHTTLGTRVGHDGVPYTQGATFDSAGRFVGRTDVSNHGRSDHANPHFHPATGPASVGPAQDIE